MAACVLSMCEGLGSKPGIKKKKKMLSVCENVLNKNTVYSSEDAECYSHFGNQSGRFSKSQVHYTIQSFHSLLGKYIPKTNKNLFYTNIPINITLFMID